MPGSTEHYGIQFPQGGENIRRQQLEDLAETVDAALFGAVGQVDDKLGSLAPSPALTVVRVSGVPTQIAEVRPDGSTRLAILRYSNDRLVAVQRFNPAATDTLTYNAAGYFTGFTTA